MRRVPDVVGDVLELARTQAAALAMLPGSLTALNRSVRALSRTIDESRQTVATVNRLAGRMDSLLDELETPLRGLAPGLTRLAGVLDDPVVSDLPDAVRRLQRDVEPVLRGLRDTQERVIAIAASTERITSFVDDAGSRLGSLPGLLRRPFRVPGAPMPAPDVPPPAIWPDDEDA
ncbi:MAG TPA: hypothetical protein VNG13_09630 [Mycobacteriales bacterium]|nr:hypothetical protein [Mycobacteriales bacterium]